MAESDGDQSLCGPPRLGATVGPRTQDAASSASAEKPTDVLSSSAAGATAMRGGVLRVGGYAVGLLASMGSTALLFRHLGVIDTGRYVTALSLVAIVGGLSDLGLTAFGVREISTRPPHERWALARDLLGLRITLTILGGIVVTAIAWAAYSYVLAVGVALASVGLLFQVTQDNFALPLLVELRLGWVAVLDLTRQLLTALLIVVLVFLGSQLLPFLGVSIPAGLVVVAIAALLVRRTRTLTPTFSWRRWRTFMSAILPYSAAVAASVLYFRISILLVSALSNGVQLGYFSASFRIIEAGTVIPALLVSSAFPIFARAAHEDHDRLANAISRVFHSALIAGAWVATSIAVGAPLAMTIVGGARFAAAAPVLAIQGIGLGAMFMNVVWGYALLSLRLYRLILLINFGALVLNVALVAPLVIVDGARGAAIGTATVEVIATVVQAVAVVRGRPHLRPSLRMLPFVVLATAAGLAPLAMTNVAVILRLLTSTALFSVVVLLTRSFPPELLDLVPRLGSRSRRNRDGQP